MGTHRGIEPRPDVDELQSLLDGMCSNAVPQKLVADGGYDSQYNHQLLREKYNIESLIPSVHGQPTTRLPINRWRYLMATAFDEETCGQRWQVETVMFMLKQHQGAALTAHTYQTRRREMGLMSVTHNIMIIRRMELFYKASLTPLFLYSKHKTSYQSGFWQSTHEAVPFLLDSPKLLHSKAFSAC